MFVAETKNQKNIINF